MVHLYQSLINTAKSGYKRKIVEDSFGNSVSNIGLIYKSILLSNCFISKIRGDADYKVGPELSEVRFGLMLPNSVPTTIVFFALQKLCAATAIINFTSGEKNILSSVKGLRYVITSKKFIEEMNMHNLINDIDKECTVIYLEDIKEYINIRQKLKALKEFFKSVFFSFSIINNKELNLIPVTLLWIIFLYTIDIASYQSGFIGGWAYVIGILSFTIILIPKVLVDSASSKIFEWDYCPEQIAVILFTSGTESEPKSVGLTHKNLYANRTQVLSTLKIKRKDKFFTCLPFFHSFGLGIGVLLPILSGCKVFLYPTPLHFEKIPKILEEKKATIFFSTDTFLKKYVPYINQSTFDNLRYLIAGAEKVDYGTHEKYKEFGIQILEGYGVTEASPAISVNTFENYKLGSVGKFIPEIEYKIEKIDGCDEGGLLYISGENVIDRYFGKKIFFDWYNTGDIVKVDDDGYLFILGRLKRFAKIAGEMVSLSQVEEYPKNIWPENNSAVCSIKNSKKGEALILLTDNKDADLKIVTDLMKSKGISNLYLPREIKIIDEFPILGSGKIDFRKLQEIAES